MSELDAIADKPFTADIPSPDVAEPETAEQDVQADENQSAETFDELHTFSVVASKKRPLDISASDFFQAKDQCRAEW